MATVNNWRPQDDDEVMDWDHVEHYELTVLLVQKQFHVLRTNCPGAVLNQFDAALLGEFQSLVKKLKLGPADDLRTALSSMFRKFTHDRNIVT